MARSRIWERSTTSRLRPLASLRRQRLGVGPGYARHEQYELSRSTPVARRPISFLSPSERQLRRHDRS
jgi:hypothetical protein